MRSIGLVGMGAIGRSVYDRITSDARLGMEIAFVHIRSPRPLRRCPPAWCFTSWPTSLSVAPI